MNKQLRIYFKNIKKNLPCYNKAMHKMLDDLKVSVNAYVEQNGTVDFEQIEQHFGSAESIAKEFAIGIDEAYIKSYKFKKRFAIVALSILAAIFIVVSTLVIYIIVKTEKDTIVYYGDTEITYTEGYIK